MPPFDPTRPYDALPPLPPSVDLETRPAARWMTDRIHAIQGLMHETAEVARQVAPKVSSRELIELVFVQPYCRIKNVVETGIAKRQTAAVYLRTLRDAGIPEEVQAGREKLFINPRLMRLLTMDRPGSLVFSNPRDVPGPSGRERRRR